MLNPRSIAILVMMMIWRGGQAADQICINFFGIETERAAPTCSWENPPSYYLIKLIDRVGLNTVRIPFSYDYVASHDMSQLDELVFTCFQLNLRVILDFHRIENSHQSPTPESGITRDVWASMWIRVLARYQSFPNVVGVGAFNELQGTDPDYANAIQRFLLHAIETRFPGRFYYYLGCPSWSQDCSAMDFSDLNRVFVEIHLYPFQGNATEISWDQEMPTRIPSSKWFIGEFGWMTRDPGHRQWALNFTTYLRKRGIRNACLWTIANSHDSGGIFEDDCRTLDTNKADLFASIWESPSLRRRRLQWFDPLLNYTLPFPPTQISSVQNLFPPWKNL